MLSSLIVHIAQSFIFCGAIFIMMFDFFPSWYCPFFLLFKSIPDIDLAFTYLYAFYLHFIMTEFKKKKFSFFFIINCFIFLQRIQKISNICLLKCSKVNHLVKIELSISNTCHKASVHPDAICETSFTFSIFI